MAYEILQDLQDALRITTLDTDSEHNSIGKAATKLAKALQQTRSRIAPAVLVALDPEIDSSDPLVEYVYQTIRGEWKVFAGRHPEPPVPLIRATLGQAISLTLSDSAAAGIVWLSAASVWPDARLEEQETNVWERIFTTARDTFEKKASSVWASLETSELTLPSAEKRAKKADTSALAENLAAAAGSTDATAPRGLTTNNQFILPNHRPAAAWAKSFGQIAAAGITSQIENATAESIAAIEEYNNALAPELSTALGPMATAERQLKILWWKEALYSASQRASYRDLDPSLAAVAMAVDLTGEVPAFSPTSAEYILRESAVRVFEDRSIRVDYFLESIAEQRSLFEPLLSGRAKDYGGRAPLLRVARAACRIDEPPEEILFRAGFSIEEPIKIWELALRLYRDSQAERLISRSE